ncbi:probable G-protein coupled receptor 139 [Haliotis cracherodii]|uniref:rhodopsin-like n=1 Tax=Haliotis rufescens TaxID=6454 RepID=UPI00201F5B37|nr:rhodopsin-like [Haliotis rufescens]XP_046332626.2 rhodopsin-like [Haliotis rufescens]
MILNRSTSPMDEFTMYPEGDSNVTAVVNENHTTSPYPDPRLIYEEYDKWVELATVSYYIDQRYLWFIFAFGFPGNIATIFTILRVGHVGTPSFYVLLLAVVDNLAIVVKLLYHQLAMYSVPIGVSGCKTLKFLGSFLVAFANWVLITLAVERFIAIHFPFSQTSTRKFKMKKAVLVVSVEAGILFWVFAPVLWTHSYIYDSYLDVMRCGEPEEYRYFVEEVWHWIDSVVYAVIPCISLFTLNVLIIRDTTHSLKTRTLLTNSINSRRGSNFNVQITAMLLTASIVFVLLTLPVCVYYVVNVYWHVSPYSVQQGWKSIFRDMAYLLCDLSHAVNFYLYFLSARKFRRNFLKVVMCSRRGAAYPNSNTATTCPNNYI